MEGADKEGTDGGTGGISFMSAKSEDEVRVANRYRQKRWRERNLYTARRRTREAMQHLRKGATSVMHEAVHNEKPKVHNALEPLGELHYGPVDGVDVPNFSDSLARATPGGDALRGDGPGLDGAYPGVHASGSELIAGPGAAPKPLGDAPGASLRALTANEARTYARLEEFKARRARVEGGVKVELIL
jgi:hypothetical protein